jgi:hypothetical protein
VSTPIWLSGTLATHRRGRFLQELLAAEPSAGGLPQGHGMCLAFAADFQDADEAEQLRWLAWTARSGRVVLLLPPLRPGVHTRPAEWKVEAVAETGLATEGSLPAVLAPEVRHCLAGQLQVPDTPSGKWAEGRAHTAYHRRHPAAGIFAVTCLPLWSSALLGREALVGGWLAELYQLAGPAATTESASAGMGLSPDHWAVLLHLCSNRFAGPDEAVDTLTRSPLFQVPPDRGRECLAELEAGGFAAGGGATETGRSALLASPYAAYLEALEATNT